MGSFFKLKILGPQLRLNESESLEVEPGNLYLFKAAHGLLITSQAWNLLPCRINSSV